MVLVSSHSDYTVECPHNSFLCPHFELHLYFISLVWYTTQDSMVHWLVQAKENPVTGV